MLQFFFLEGWVSYDFWKQAEFTVWAEASFYRNVLLWGVLKKGKHSKKNFTLQFLLDWDWGTFTLSEIKGIAANVAVIWKAIQKVKSLLDYAEEGQILFSFLFKVSDIQMTQI